MKIKNNDGIYIDLPKNMMVSDCGEKWEGPVLVTGCLFRKGRCLYEDSSWSRWNHVK